MQESEKTFINSTANCRDINLQKTYGAFEAKHKEQVCLLFGIKCFFLIGTKPLRRQFSNHPTIH